MKVRLLSDLHLEHDEDRCFYPGSGDVLVLAGDICCAVDLDKKVAGSYYRGFFETCARNFNKVFYVMGNHEHYGFNFSHTAQKLKSLLPANVTLLDNEAVHYGGVWFLGCTLWTDFRGGNPLALRQASGVMNDYKSIRFGAKYRKFQPQDAFVAHNESMFWLQKTIDELDGDIFVITHHHPSYESCLYGEYRGNECNYLYTSELSGFISRRPQIKHWVAGHMHNTINYTIEQCQVACNPRGYQDQNSLFNPNFTIEVQ